MKHKHIFRALNLVFIGLILLLINLNVINFRWSYFSIIPAAALIYLGLSLIFNYFGDKNWAFGAKLISFIALWGLIFIQLSPSRFETSSRSNFWFKFDPDDYRIDDISIEDGKKLPNISQNLSILYSDSTAQKQRLEINGGVLSIDLKDTTQNLINANIKGKGENMMYDLSKINRDGASVIVFEPKNGVENRKKSVFISEYNKVDLSLNPNILWSVKASGGVGSFDFDFSKFKIEHFEFNGGASSLGVKFGTLVPKTHVKINSGVASVDVEIPENAACEIKINSALSSKHFDGFVKVSEDTYRTSNFETATQQIYIEFDGGLSSFKVKKY